MSGFVTLLRRLAELVGPPEQIRGNSSEELSAVAGRLGCSLPAPLRDFYADVGLFKPIMDSHHHFTPLAELQFEDDALVFCGENQFVMFWSVARQELSQPDPPVNYRRQEGPWDLECRQLSRFLTHFTCWQLINAMPSSGCCELEVGMVLRLRKTMQILCPAADYHMGSLVDFDRRIIVSRLIESQELFVGAPDDETLKGFQERNKIKLNWL